MGVKRYFQSNLNITSDMLILTELCPKNDFISWSQNKTSYYGQKAIFSNDHKNVGQNDDIQRVMAKKQVFSKWSHKNDMTWILEMLIFLKYGNKRIFQSDLKITSLLSNGW